jgi:hypothetical protein
MSDKPKYSAAFIDEHRDFNLPHDWWDSVYDDFIQVCEILGVSIETRHRKAYRGQGRDVTISEPCIYFSGFYSQGDGASFSGWYYAETTKAIRIENPDASPTSEYRRVLTAEEAPAKIREYAPNDETLHNIADELCFLYRWYGGVTARISQGGNYLHSYTMRLDDWDFQDDREDEDANICEIVETTLIDNMRALADWLYERLEEEHEYLTSDEAVIESLEANEIEEDLDEDEDEDA